MRYIPLLGELYLLVHFLFFTFQNFSLILEGGRERKICSTF